ncbi:MAG TPA: hypothetical protein VFM97_08050 [Gammaproteobacteria bacterium]|nr:hypothetical protein [Gammaproteobacteria bacterium]
MKIVVMIAAAALAFGLAGCASTIRTVRNLNPFMPSTSFQHWDINGDGVISQSEAAKYGPLQKNFNTIDSNRNGVIDQSEYKAATTNLSPTPGFSAYDLNGDGFITEKEADAAPNGGLDSVFDDVDADGDGNISPAEFKAATLNLLGGVSFSSIDTDGDGAISGDEAKANAPLLWQEFDRVDLNGDGQISKQEFQAFQRSRNNGSNQNQNGNNNNGQGH